MFDETYYGEHNNVANDPFKVGIFGGNLENMGDYKNTSWAIDILDKFSGPGDDPLFLSVGLTAPHVDWVAPQEYFDRFPLDTIVLPEIIENDISDLPSFARLFLDSAFQQSVLDADAWARIIQGYLATVSFTDDMIGRLLQGLTESGLEENTSIVLWSDHGQHFGEKEKWNKFTLWEEAARSPLVIVDPDIGTPGQHVEDVVEFLDIFPTILDLVGAAPVSWTQGRSLVPLMEGDETPWNGVAFSNIYGSFSVRTGDYRYSRYEDGSEELYDIRHDPHEWVNLAGDPSYAVVKSELSADLNQYFQGHSIFGNCSPSWTAVYGLGRLRVAEIKR
jgi:arylsulfatase A-like enzyme